jgi:penicillin-binding protein A
MQDLKYLTEKKRSSSFKFPRPSHIKKKLASSGANTIRKFRLPTGKRRKQLERFLMVLAIALALIPLFTMVFRKAPVVFRNLAATLKSNTSLSPSAEAAKPPPSSFETACLLLDSANPVGDRLTARTVSGETLYYTIDEDLQNRVHDFMAKYQVPYGVFVAIEPATGRILAMTAHSSVDPNWDQDAFFELYPMASLFKIITASAALETKRITPETVVEFRGIPTLKTRAIGTPAHGEKTTRWM